MNYEELERARMSDYWFNYQKFYEFVARQERFKTYVEVGVWKGHSLVYLVSLLKKAKRGFEMFAVDLFDESWQHTSATPDSRIAWALYNYNLLRNDMRDCVHDIRGLSWECAKGFDDGSIDFCFIDAAHDEASVTKDIHAWMPKMRSGGLISGHDYDPNNTATGVPAAVDKFFGSVERGEGDVWFKFV